MSRSDRVLIAAAAGAVVLAVAAAVVLLVPTDEAPAADAAGLLLDSGVADPSASPSPSPLPSSILVDVAGAVVRPGLLELPAGARVGDALAAAGGYATDADLDAAAAAINLAQPLSDGEQVRVPRIGEAIAATGPAGSGDEPAPAGGGAPAPAAGGLVNLNTASPEQLEALPGIGPVTVQKIVAARQEQPFSSLDDAVARGVIHRGQLEDIRELATAG